MQKQGTCVGRLNTKIVAYLIVPHKHDPLHGHHRGVKLVDILARVDVWQTDLYLVRYTPTREMSPATIRTILQVDGAWGSGKGR